MPVRMHQGSITELAVDVIVNAANTELQHGGGVAAAIARAAGPALREDSQRVGFCPLGEVAETRAGKLRAQRVYHIPTIDYTTGQRASLAQITAATAKALEKCATSGYRSIAFPLLGAGIVGLDPLAVAHAMRQAIDRFPQLDVVICAYSSRDQRAVSQVWSEE